MYLLQNYCGRNQQRLLLKENVEVFVREIILFLPLIFKILKQQVFWLGVEVLKSCFIW